MPHSRDLMTEDVTAEVVSLLELFMQKNMAFLGDSTDMTPLKTTAKSSMKGHSRTRMASDGAQTKIHFILLIPW